MTKTNFILTVFLLSFSFSVNAQLQTGFHYKIKTN